MSDQITTELNEIAQRYVQRIRDNSKDLSKQVGYVDPLVIQSINNSCTKIEEAFDIVIKTIEQERHYTKKSSNTETKSTQIDLSDDKEDSKKEESDKIRVSSRDSLQPQKHDTIGQDSIRNTVSVHSYSTPSKIEEDIAEETPEKTRTQSPQKEVETMPEATVKTKEEQDSKPKTPPTFQEVPFEEEEELSPFALIQKQLEQEDDEQDNSSVH